MRQIKYLLSFCFFLFLSCAKKEIEMKSAYSFEKAKIDSAVKKDEIFRWLNSQNDFDMSHEGVRKKTSAAQYYWKIKDEIEIPSYYFSNNCRAEIFKDTLIIRIGTTTYLSDHGIKIKYKNGNYNSLPFQSYDIVLPKSMLKPKVYYLRNRKLILNQFHYKTGDSVFGRIHTEIEEPTQTNSIGNEFTIEHFADGYFRAKIGEY